MRLVNKTCIPSYLLTAMIDEALVHLSVDRASLDVRFTQGRRLFGTAYSNGLVHIVMPISRRWGLTAYWKRQPAGYTALKVYLLIVHELRHIQDYQSGAKDMHNHGPHDLRPHERRAFAAEIRAMQSVSPTVVKKLTEWLEETR